MCIRDRYMASPPCTIFHNPDLKWNIVQQCTILSEESSRCFRNGSFWNLEAAGYARKAPLEFFPSTFSTTIFEHSWCFLEFLMRVRSVCICVCVCVCVLQSLNTSDVMLTAQVVAASSSTVGKGFFHILQTFATFARLQTFSISRSVKHWILQICQKSPAACRMANGKWIFFR